MEIPDVLVVTKSDLGAVADRALADLRAALRSLEAASTPVLAVSSLTPPTGVEELIAALDERHRALDLPGRRRESRRAAALSEFAIEHGERGVRALGGRRAARGWLATLPAELDAAALVRALEQRAQVRR
jgi:LAO/AO transport system kinase